MKKKALLSIASVLTLSVMVSCAGTKSSSSSESGSIGSASSSTSGASSGAGSSTQVTSSSGSSAQTSSSASDSKSSHTSSELNDYIAGLRRDSLSNHFYFHYYRYGNTPAAYQDWDFWAWPYRPAEGEGTKFDWTGRTANPTNPLTVTGDATVDGFGGACVDIDLMKTYVGGWNNVTKRIGTASVKFTDDVGALETQIGLQIVQSSTRTSGGSFWTNDGGNNYVTLENFKLENQNGSFSYHVFANQYHVNGTEMTALPDGADPNNPFAGDDGKNVTYGNTKYGDASMTDKARQNTSPAFLKGTDGGATNTSLQHGAGVGYQIMVSSFADSDGDGFGDIQGIIDKLPYLESLHVNALWLTPIQMSDSYHGYDISDYTQVDPKFGSATSAYALAHGGVVTAASAMEDYKALLAAAHSKGMAVVMDLVINHTSTSNVWFTKSAQLDAKYRGYYQWGNHLTNASKISVGNYWYPYGDTAYSYYAKFGSGMPELNYMYQSTRDAVAGIANDWASLGVDGFRMDAVKHIFLRDEVDTSVATTGSDTMISDSGSGVDYSSDLTKNLNFWKELVYDVKAVNPNVFFVGENFDGHAFHVAPFYEAFDSMFDFYSYFNLTSAANTAMGGAYGKTNFSLIAGKRTDTGVGAGGAYSPSGDAAATNPGTSLKFGGTWDIRSELETNNSYRKGTQTEMTDAGYDSLGGMFTSNHDIARTINRIHASAGDSNGITAQGEVTSGDYASYDKEATLVQIAQLMMPGCTWIYYGDELGMTGNLQGKKSTDGYADLTYRQPMKWKHGSTVGQDYTCGYSITGSGTSVSWDNINSTSTVADVTSQTASSSSHLAALSSFANYKSTLPALIRGAYYPNNWDGMTNYLNFRRVLGIKAYHVIINFDRTAVMDAGPGLAGTTLATFGNVTHSDTNVTIIGPQSAVLYEEATSK